MGRLRREARLQRKQAAKVDYPPDLNSGVASRLQDENGIGKSVKGMLGKS